MRKTVLSFLVLIFIICSLQAQDKNNWGLFRGDAKLSGVTTATLPQTLELLWSFKTGDNIKSSPVVYDNKIVIGSTDGWIYTLTMKGTLLWKYNTTNSIEAPPMIANGVVYCGNLDGTLFALDLNTGKVKWKYKAENQIMGSPNLWQSAGKNYIVVGSYDYNLHCVDALTGKLKWKYETENYVNGCFSSYCQSRNREAKRKNKRWNLCSQFGYS
jgi:outer membrane protein assembly factor BamB